MKKLKDCLVVVCVIICIYGCGNSKTRKVLLKKWHVESITSIDIDKDVANMKLAIDTAKDSLTRINILSKIRFDQAVLEAYKTMVLEYKADSTFDRTISFMGESKTKTGKWMLSEDGKKIISIDEKLNKDTVDIAEVTSEKLVTNSSDKTVSIIYRAVKL
jgi:hypothetical protein